MARQIALIGFGEAAQAFVGAPGWSGSLRAFDKLTCAAESRAAKLADYAKHGVAGASTLQEALEGADVVISLVTAGEALAAASEAARFIAPRALYFDMNSVSPDTKRSAAQAIEGSGAHYIDAAVMSPVSPGRLQVPLLVSGPEALEGERVLRGVGFEAPRTVGSHVGEASAIKMIRSVLIKGIEALTAEAMMAAFEAGVAGEVLRSLDASERAMSWAERADYNLERMMVHGVRRAEEMEEAVRTLQSLGIEPALTRQTARRQRELGALGVAPPPALEPKIERLKLARTKAA